MRKTTVYLEDEEADGIRRLAAETGKSQADLIREGVRRVLRRSPKRKFHSMGIGEATGKKRRAGWTPDEVYEKAFGLGRRQR
jgi:Arc/MetJ-type ribon-helix-helix transcriptional regulator